MLRRFWIPATVVAFLIATCLSLPTATAKEPLAKLITLLDENNLDGWGYYLVPEKDAEKQPGLRDVWSISDGVLACKGTPMGYLATKKTYKNFILQVEWRWPKDTTPTNSGVFVHITGKDQALPKCVEVQLCHKKAGDLIGFHGVTIQGPAKRLLKKESPIGGAVSILSHTKDAELPPGEWNVGHITVNEGTISVKINGKTVNSATGLPTGAGKIGLQSEGGPIEFRNVILCEIPEKSTPTPQAE